MSNKKLLFIVGKTSSGKDTIARYIEQKYNIRPICSFTTREKRKNETDGVEHYFISPSEMAYKVKHEHVLAYTKFDNGVEYCSTIEAMQDDIMSYIIDPNGIKFFKEAGFDLKYKIIYVDLNEEIIKRRALSRGDNENKVDIRLDAEREQFNNFKASKSYDYLINTDTTQKTMYQMVDEVMKNIVSEWK